MKKINAFDFDTSSGLKSVEIYQGDILSWNNETDLLIVSSYEGGYDPVAGTLIGDLKDRGINLKKLATKPDLDMRASLNTLLTEVLADQFFSRILIFEMKSSTYYKDKKNGLKDIFENLLISLMVCEKKGFTFRNMILPVIGTGKQRIPVNELAGILPSVMERFFNELSHLEKVIFIDRNAEKTQILSDNLNQKLERPGITAAKDNFGMDVRLNIQKKIKAFFVSGSVNDSLMNEAIKTIRNQESPAWQIAMTGRKLLEAILNHFIEEPSGTLFEKINSLKSIPVADWVQSYMHMIRIFGNENGHASLNKNKVPASLKSEDVLLNLICIERVLDFALTYKDKFIVNVPVGKGI